MKPLIRAEISAQALRGNLARIRQVASHSRVMAVVKANAYGHGSVSTARCLKGVDAFAVARFAEAVELREAGIAEPIVLLEGVFSAAELAEAARLDLQLVIHSDEQVQLLATAPATARFVVWLKIDTGMNRLGLRAGQIHDALKVLHSFPAAVRELRVLTHFVAADEAEDPRTEEQITLFAGAIAGYRWAARSLCNSAGLFTRSDAQAEWVRPGLTLYGASPFAQLLGTELGLQPAMRLVSTVIAVRDVRAGESVGYGGDWRAGRDSRVAIVAAGYADGLLRASPQGAPVLVAGRRAGIVGRPSMDMIAVEITGRDDVRMGDPAVLWGPELPVEEIAAHAGTIPYELLCAVSQRVPRVMV